MNGMISDYRALGLSPYGATPNDRQLEWLRREKTVFFHFGINTFYGREWGDGTEDPRRFCPTEPDCRQWVRTVRDAGFSAAILTAKHHDGFCLWPTAYTEHSIKNSPYRGGKGDIVREFTDACREYGVKAGIYLSPWDRNNPLWGTPAYSDYYNAQLEELFGGAYGEIWECWWDGAGSAEAKYDWERWEKTVHRLQPQAVIFGSMGAAPWVDTRWVGNERGIAGENCWAQVRQDSILREVRESLNTGEWDGERFAPAECDVSIRPGWFYHEEQDSAVRSAEGLVDLWFSSVGRNCGLLLNIPPDRRGLLCEGDVQSISRFGARLRDIFADDLLRDAALTADAVRPGCAPEHLLFSDGRQVYAPGEGVLTPTVTALFPRPREVGCVRIGEAIALGHHIRRFAVDILTGGEWRPLLDGACVGYCRAERFSPVLCEGIRLRITEAVAEPVLTFFGVYGDAGEHSGQADAPRGVNFVRETEREPGRLVCRFSGIAPFDTVRFSAGGTAPFAVEAFDGTDFYPVASGVSVPGRNEVRFSTVEGAYQFRIVTDAPDITDPQACLS